MNGMDIARLLRVKQWTKNVFVLAAFIFSNRITTGTTADWWHVAFAFFGMSLISSGTYIFNDLSDVEKDRQHPIKKNRPIASGKISKSFALGAGIFCLVFGLGLGLAVSVSTLSCLLSYLGIQIVYNLFLRNISIADVASIASGFVVRVILGAVAIDALLSGWILLCTATLALMLGFGKRRHEFHLKKASGFDTRSSLASYNGASLDMLVLFSSAIAAMSYGVYSIESPTARSYPGLILTTPFVLYAICRYLVIVFADGESGEPESIVLKDKQLLICFAGFLISAIAALKGFHLEFLYR